MSRINCNLCPNMCGGDIGICGNRVRNIGKFSSIALDPIEKKPLMHVYPGSQTLSFGGIGCNLQCPWCQNYKISLEYKNIQTFKLLPTDILNMAEKKSVKSVSFTYNEPSIYLEYIAEVSELLKNKNIDTFLVSSGYICKQYLPILYKNIKAANIDLKCFSKDNYLNIIKGSLDVVLDTLKFINNSPTWLEITTLIIPGFNDGDNELNKLTNWIFINLGGNIPIHFSAFHPSYKYKKVSKTPAETIYKAVKIAKNNGLNFVYTGNIPNGKNFILCPKCKTTINKESLFFCHKCGIKIPGIF